MSAHVLVIEDDPVVARLLAQALEAEPEPLSVVAFDSARAGLAHLAGHSVDCVLLDYKLQGQDGLDCLRQIRQRYPDLPVIIVTAHGSEEVAVEAMKLGAQDYVVKDGQYLSKVALCVRSAMKSRIRSSRPARGSRDSFVGRTEEMESLRSGVEDALRGRGSVFLLSGESGIGKSHLARHAATYARIRSLQVFWGRCQEGSAPPAHWPWIEILRAYTRDCPPLDLHADLGTGGALIARLDEEIRARVPDTGPASALSAEDAPFRLADAISQFLDRAACRHPLLLVLDDLHLADNASLAILRFVAADLADKPLMMMGTFRNSEVGRRHPLLSFLGEIVKQPATRQLVLSGFSKAEVAQYIEETAGSPLPAAIVSTVHRETEGNPFFVGEVVRLLLAEQRDAAGEGCCHVTIPPTVCEAITRRLDHVSLECREVLRAAAVAGREFAMNLLERVTGRPPDRLLAVLDEAIGARIVNALAEVVGEYRFSHGLIRDALYEELGKTRRTDLHRQIGESLEHTHAAALGPHLGRIAHHFYEASEGGGAEKAAHYSLLAGDRAAALMGYEEAARHYERALTALAFASPGQETQRCETLIRLSELSWRNGDVERGRATGKQAIELARHLGAADLVARAALGFSGQLQMFGALVCNHDVVAALEEAIEMLGGDDSPLHAAVMARLAEELALSLDEQQRWRLARAAIDIARRGNDLRLLGSVLRATFWALWVPEDIDGRTAHAAEMRRVADQTGDRTLRLEAQLNQLWLFFERGEVATLRHEIEECSRLADELRQPYHQWIVATARACLALVRGRLRTAESLAQRALDLGQSVENQNAALCFGVQSVHLLWLWGALDNAERYNLGFADAYTLVAPIVHCSIAITCSEAGREPEARREFERFAGSDFTNLPRNLTWLPGVAFLSEVCAYLKDAPRARHLYELLSPFDGRTVLLPPVVVFGPVAHYLGQLAATLRRWDDAEHHFEEAIELSARMEGRQWVARSQVAYARMLLARQSPGDDQRARALAADAAAVAEELGMHVLAETARTLQEVSLTSEAPTSVPGPGTPSHARPEPEKATFRKEGEIWTTIFRGTVSRFRDIIGMRDIAYLLQRPGEGIYCVTLYHACCPRAEVGLETARDASALGDDLSTVSDFWPEEILDDKGKKTLRNELKDLSQQLEEATRDNDLGRMSSLQTNIELVTDALVKGTGFHGDHRPGSIADKIRTSIQKACKKARKKIRESDPALEDHLRESIKTGFWLSYTPKHPIHWET